MKWIKLLLLLSGLSGYQLVAQNLVPDSSFEEHTKYACRLLDPPRYITEYFNDWYVPTDASTDLWNSDTTDKSNCTNTISTLQATHLLGSTKPMIAHTGTFFLGMYTTYPKYGTYREYIQVRLKRSLTVGRVYYAQMYVAPPYSVLVFSNNMGMYFSTDSILKRGLLPKPPSPILAQPQVNDTNVIEQPLDWRKVSGYFVADKPYQFLTIGNFFDDAHTKRTNFVEKGINYWGGPASYYCVDDVSVTETSFTAIVPNLGADTTLCAGRSLSISLPNQSGTTYRWQDGSTALNRTIDQSGTYYVTATTGAFSVTDTLHVTVLPTISLPPDTVICQGERLTLKPIYPTKSFVWNDGSTDSTLTVSQTGQYWVRVPPARCNIADTTNVQVVDCPGEVPNVITPNGDGKNDALVIRNIDLVPWRMEIYNRWGRRVYEAEPYRNDWSGEGLPSGVYYYGLTNQRLRRSIKGIVHIIR